MVIYSVHEPPNVSADRLESAEQLVFVKDGFSWFAAALPPIWLLMKRMWLEFAIYVGATGLLVWALTAAGAADLANAILLAAQIVFGFEAGALYSAALERRGWHLVGTVAGRNSEDCERRFLEVWLPTRTEIPRLGSGPAAPVAGPTWAQTALAQAKDAIARGRRAWARA
ncbi:MAG: DUF2628 domain-containing protein [Hyphomicrobium sp.]|uniref:DUF2628 domain-containing protein n=1 Tax=Hyphomicrobium sp. TaxID=82 RepID=UPI0025B9F5FE|nr:DUF2628 domain-containing protein [Hyphomicrobium sp.]MBZ0209341.1 DUF2628 domain-containing protein [Hyphomicrobium sp.]